MAKYTMVIPGILAAIAGLWWLWNYSDMGPYATVLAVIFGFSYLRKQVQRAVTTVSRSEKSREGLTAFTHFQIWMGTTKVEGTKILPGILVALFLGQMAYGMEPSIMDFGLVKEAVRQEGEYWRWFTATLLHGGIVHIYFNATALLGLSDLFLRFSRWGWFAITYLLAGIGGAVASQYLLPEGISVGASGAILGIFGFVFALSLRHSRIFPISFTINSAVMVAFVALYGLVGSSFIDNAGHAGGFVVGALLGLIPSEQSVRSRIDTLSEPFRQSQGGELARSTPRH